MFYTYLRGLVMLILWSINGNAHFHNTEKIPSLDENYILVAPHRTWWDPVYMAFATKPNNLSLWPKKNSFQIVSLVGGFACVVPSRLTVKIQILLPSSIQSMFLKKSNRSLIMFPSGSRHSNDVKGGVALIAKMAKVRIMPVTYTGPMTLKGLVSRERIDMNFGNPIDISDIKKMNDEGIEMVADRIQSEFQRLDEETKQWHNNKKPNPLWWLIRIPALILAIIIGILTILFTFVASFVWDPDKKRKQLQ